jgi:hypothetical protein
MENNTDKQLIIFLRNLANNLENGKLSSEQTLNIGEFYISYQFQNQLKENTEEFNETNIKKYLFLGWYIYCMILKNKLTN